ncbi:MAG: S-layer homology domain-containing protein, partial [Clostridia bacterium]|nr:S-layer homology domain-containing protein [Clostridia bacterium]
DLAKDENLEPITPQETVEEAVSFDDLGSVPWAQESISYLAQNNIINGVEKKKFAPNAFVTREQFVKMVVLAMNLYNEDAQTTQFMDVEQRGWYNSYVASAVEHGIVHGVDNEHFGVGQNITRAEMAAILCRAAQSAGKTLADTQKYEYADNADIPDYAREAVKKLGAQGIMNGIGNGLFAPREQATRAMAAKVIYLLMGVN